VIDRSTIGEGVIDRYCRRCTGWVSDLDGFYLYMGKFYCHDCYFDMKRGD
jgi:hypothetical protein